jgi:hypothetical protein
MKPKGHSWALQVQLVDHRLGDKANAVFGAAETFGIQFWVFSYNQSFRNDHAMVDDDIAELGMTPDLHTRQYYGILKAGV